MSFQKGDLVYHFSYPGWIWEVLEVDIPMHSPDAVCLELVWILPDARWPRPGEEPHVGHILFLRNRTLELVSEMEFLAKAAQ